MWYCEGDDDSGELHSVVRAVPAAAGGRFLTMSGRNLLPKLVDNGDSLSFSSPGSDNGPVQRAADGQREI